MEQNLSQYKIFYEVAKAGNISKAAKEPACHQQGHQQIRGQSGAFSVYPQLPGSSADF
mgnify:CR=1 FL=1